MAAVVPTLTNRTVLPDVSPQAFGEAGSYSADSFGAGKSRALIRLGDSIVTAGDELTKAMTELQYQDDKREFKKLDTEFSAFLRTVSHGDGTAENPGYLSTSGEHAINGYSIATAAIEKKRKDLLAGSSNPRVKEMFTIAADERSGSEADKYLVHVSNEREKANVAVAEARISNAISDAATAWSDPKILERSLVLAESEIKDIGAQQGWPQEQIDQKIRESQSKIIEGTISAAIPENNRTAQALLNQYGGLVDGVSKAEISQRIDARNRQLIADSDRANSLAEKALVKEQAANWTSTIVQAARKEIGAEEIVRRAAVGSINGAQMEDAISFLRTEMKEEGNPEGALSHKIQLMLGQENLDDITSDLTMSTVERNNLVEVWDQKQQQGDILNTNTVKLAEESIIRLVVGDPDPMTKRFSPSQNEALDASLTEFRERVLKGENAQIVKNEVIERYRAQPASIQSIPRPKYWGPVRDGPKQLLLQQEDAARKATKEAVRAGNLSEEEAMKQFKLLDQNKEFIERLGN